MRKLRTKVQAGDNVYFKGLEGEVMNFTSQDFKAKTFAIDFYSEDIYLEFKVTRAGYKVITSNSPKWLINKTYKPKEFTVLFRPGTGMKTFIVQTEMKKLISMITSWQGPHKITTQAIYLKRMSK